MSEEKTEVQENVSDQTAEEKLYTQSELDSVLNAERVKFEAKLAETEKLAAMSEEKKAEYLRGQFERTLAEREAAVARRELMADAADKLDAAGLPKTLSECLDYSGREACALSLERVSAAFENALAEAVTQRLRGRTPKFSQVGATDAFLDGLGLYNNK